MFPDPCSNDFNHAEHDQRSQCVRASDVTISSLDAERLSLLLRAPVNIHPFIVVELMLQINKFYGDKNTVTNILFGVFSILAYLMF